MLRATCEFEIGLIAGFSAQKSVRRHSKSLRQDRSSEGVQRGFSLVATGEFGPRRRVVSG